MKKRVSGLSEAVKEALLRYTWPGNVRELRNVIERAVVLSRGGQIELSDLPLELQQNGSAHTPQVNRLESLERSLLEDALKTRDGNVSAAALALGVSRSTLRYRMKKYGLVRG